MAAQDMTRLPLAEYQCPDLTFVPDGSVNLIVTHPPSFGSLTDDHALGRLSATLQHDRYLAELDEVLAESTRVLTPGGHVVCVTSPVARPDDGLPLAGDVHARTRSAGLVPARAIRWLPDDEASPGDAPFYGAPNQPCGEPLCEGLDILVMQKPGARLVSAETQIASRLPAKYFAACSSSVWHLPAVRDPQQPQRLPSELTERLIRMFSYAGDTVLDLFAETATARAADSWGRNAIGVPARSRRFDPAVGGTADAEWPDGEEIAITRGPAARQERDAGAGLPSV
jgi:site-specific DNA-methyltransferase (adenine-specific)